MLVLELSTGKSKNSISSKDIDEIFDENITTVYAEDIISFAREKGWYEGKDKNFPFQKHMLPLILVVRVFAKLEFGPCLTKLPRGWINTGSMQKEILSIIIHLTMEPQTQTIMQPTVCLSGVKPTNKVSVHDMMNFMRDHLENTELDMSKDVGAGPF